MVGITKLSPKSYWACVRRGGSRMGTEGAGVLNNKDLGLKLEINDDLRLSNSNLIEKSLSRGGLQPTQPPSWIRPSCANKIRGCTCC
jgi:hypothetical protein